MDRGVKEKVLRWRLKDKIQGEKEGVKILQGFWPEQLEEWKTHLLR